MTHEIFLELNCLIKWKKTTSKWMKNCNKKVDFIQQRGNKLVTSSTKTLIGFPLHLSYRQPDQHWKKPLYNRICIDIRVLPPAKTSLRALNYQLIIIFDTISTTYVHFNKIYSAGAKHTFTWTIYRRYSLSILSTMLSNKYG